MKEEMIDTQRIYGGRVITLRKDTILLPSGKHFDREVVEHNGSAAAVSLLDGYTLVLVRQYRHAAGEVLLELPAGTLQPGESPEECISRELVEETGYHPGRLERLLTLFLAPGYSNEVAYIFLATDLREVGPRREEDEFIDVVKLPISDAPKMILTSKIRDAKTISGILTYALKLGQDLSSLG